MNKIVTRLVTVSSLVAGVALGFSALAPVKAHASVGPQDTVSTAPTAQTVVASPTVIEVPELTVVASVPSKRITAPTARTWKCGEMQDLYTGGRAATCEFR